MRSERTLQAVVGVLQQFVCVFSIHIIIRTTYIGNGWQTFWASGSEVNHDLADNSWPDLLVLLRKRPNILVYIVELSGFSLNDVYHHQHQPAVCFVANK